MERSGIVEQYMYDKMLEEVESLINENRIDEAEELLQKLRCYKPIRLGMSYVEALSKLKRTGALSTYVNEINGKYFYSYLYPYVEKVTAVQKKWAHQCNDYFNEQRIDVLHKVLRNDAGEFLKLYESTCIPVDSHEKWLEVLQRTYSLHDYIGFIIIESVFRRRYVNEPQWDFCEWIYSHNNMLCFTDALNHKETFLLMESGQDAPYIIFLASCLAELGCQVIYIKNPLCVEADNIEIKDTITISLDNVQQNGVQTIYTPIEVVSSDGTRRDNKIFLVEYIYRKLKVGKLLHVISRESTIDELSMRPLGNMRLNTLFSCFSGIQRCNLAYGYYGDYLDYISGVYLENCHELISPKSEKRFSIVIPARNSAYTLRHTLRTCLEQRYKGDYEIVVSDNSTGHNAAVFELCQELNDPRIVYIKTPRDLRLARSFEYAFLHTTGEYVLSLGSDDGLLPWALETLDTLIKQYPDEEILQWERGFYAWPGFGGGQQHQFIIPGEYKRDECEIYYREASDYILSVLKNPGEMYELPMLYINSCFKRSYFKTLLNKTGRLWDGICQDIYMGVVTACIHPKIFNISYPLTIAGMSNGSVGATANVGTATNDAFEKMMQEVQTDSNMGAYWETYLECLIPDTGSDVSSLYLTLLRAIHMGILPEQYMTDIFDWKKMFCNISKALDIRDVAFDRKIHQMRYAAMQHGDAFVEWFDKTIYEPMLEPQLFDEAAFEVQKWEKTYVNGELMDGSWVYDASEYGVENIYDAVKLFEKLTEL